MATFKLVIGTKEGKCAQKEISGDHANHLIGKRLGEKVSGHDLGFEGYEFEITGGSDYCGFPMRKEIPGILRKQIFATQGVGIKKVAPGIRIRKTVAGNTVHDKTVQINLKVIKEGKQKLVEEKPAEEKAEKAEKAAA